VRLDVLLFELRLFKSRSQATAAQDGGRALLNGARAKPSHEDGADRTRTLEVLALPRGSLSKAAARELVREVRAGLD
jgi:ribosomal 50S subunit-recycling heat shock protein